MSPKGLRARTHACLEMAKGRREDRTPDDDARFGEACKARLAELIAFAQVYRNWSMGELAAFLGRDVHNLIPGSGVPKADLIYQLARALDWPPASVFSQVCGDSPVPIERERSGTDDYRELNRAAFAAFTEGRYEEMISLALRMQAVAKTPEQRAEAALRECGGWEGLGRYEQALEAIRRGLSEDEIPAIVRLRLRSNLAHLYLVLDRPLDGEGIAGTVVERIERDGMTDDAARGVLAMALDVRGQSRRLRAIQEADDRVGLARLARADLVAAIEAWTRHAAVHGVANYAAMAHTARAAAIANDVALGELTATDCLERLLDLLDPATEISRVPSGVWRESYGWICVFGCEVALRLGEGVDDPEHHVGVFSNKGHEIAQACGNWALRARMLAVDYLRYSHSAGIHSQPSAVTLDRDDMVALAGVMARFPRFRPLGWELVRHAPKIG